MTFPWLSQPGHGKVMESHGKSAIGTPLTTARDQNRPQTHPGPLGEPWKELRNFHRRDLHISLIVHVFSMTFQTRSWKSHGKSWKVSYWDTAHNRARSEPPPNPPWTSGRTLERIKQFPPEGFAYFNDFPWLSQPGHKSWKGHGNHANISVSSVLQNWFIIINDLVFWSYYVIFLIVWNKFYKKLFISQN